MKEFSRTTAGRMLAFAVAMALLGGGVAALIGQPSATWVIALFFPVAIALGILGVAYASQEHWSAAIFCAILLPFALFLYVVGLGVVVGSMPTVGYALGALGAGALAFALRPSERVAGRSSETAESLGNVPARGR